MDLGKLGARIKQMREKRRLRQAEVASALRLSAQAVSKWERGENAPDIAVLVPLAHLLDVSVEWILSGTEAEPGTFSATVFATSLTGYAERAFRTTPGALAAWANSIHFGVTEAVLNQGGVPIKCVGDGFLGFFSGANQALRALVAARQARSTCDRPELTIVLHAGPIFLGSVGHPEHARTDIIGATVNTAFLLMPFVAANCPDRMAMTESVATLLPPNAVVEHRGETRVLGQQSPIGVFSLAKPAIGEPP
jgi:transcriptional regulator with XRE-family HTH domain